MPEEPRPPSVCSTGRLFTLAITEREVQDLLNHTDSPYIRAIGFLYLRYVGNPRNHWEWIQRYVQDEEAFTPSPEGYGKSVAMGDFVRDVFLEQYYFESIFPRVPKPIQDNFVSKLTSMGLPSKAVGNGGQGGTDRRGIEEPNRRPASVKASLSVAFGQRAPNRATAREEGRGLGAGMRGALGAGGTTRSTPPRISKDAEPPRRDARSAAGGRDGGDRDGARPAARDEPGRDRDRHANGAPAHDRDQDRHERHGRDVDRRRLPDSHRERERDQPHGRDRDRDRQRDYKRHRPDHDSRRGPGYDSRDHERHRR